MLHVHIRSLANGLTLLGCHIGEMPLDDAFAKQPTEGLQLIMVEAFDRFEDFLMFWLQWRWLT
jgi:hypothetical protein